MKRDYLTPIKMIGIRLLMVLIWIIWMGLLMTIILPVLIYIITGFNLLIDGTDFIDDFETKYL